jgi:hypothetical protein
MTEKQRIQRKEANIRFRVRQQMLRSRKSDIYTFPKGGSDPFDHYRDNATWKELKEANTTYLMKHAVMKDTHPALEALFHAHLTANLKLIKEDYERSLGLID